MRIDAANPNESPWRCFQAPPEVRAAVEQALCSRGNATGKPQSGEMFILFVPATDNASPEEVAQKLSDACDTRTMLAEVRGLVSAVAQGTFDLRKENGQLQRENESLRAMQYGGFFNFVLDVEREDFRAFAFIMALGNRSAAAASLKVPQRSFYDRLERWKTRGKSYQQMLRWIQWRKAVSRKIKLRLPDPKDSGSPGETATNPDLLQEVVEAVGEATSRNYPSLLREILSVLLDQNPQNWASARRDLVTLIKEELPQ
jgi:hypothetical protein